MAEAGLESSKSNDLDMKIYWRFTDAAIEATPEKSGVFAFFDEHGSLILLGSTTKSLRAALREHWKGFEGASTCGAAHIAWEQHSNPLEREAELVEQYAKEFGRIPRRRAI